MANARLTTFAGLVAATAAAFWMRPPIPLRVAFWKAPIIAAAWIVTTILAGTAGMCAAKSLIEKRPAWPAAHHLLAAAAAWILIPPLFLTWLHGSLGALGLSACAAAATAAGLYAMIPAAHFEPFETWEPAARGPHFADVPAPDSKRPQALAIAVCVEGAAILVLRRQLFLATLLLAAGSFLFVWKRLTSLNTRPRDGAARPAARAGTAALLAMLILVPLLLARFVRMGGEMATAHAAAAHVGSVDPNDAYQGIILFTVQQKQKELPPPPELGACGKMQITIRNGDNRLGRIDMGVLLTNSSSPEKPSMYLGMKPIVSTEPEHFSLKSAPLDEELEFAIPAHPAIRKFDEITVFFFPAEERSTLGARVGIRQFELIPRSISEPRRLTRPHLIEKLNQRLNPPMKIPNAELLIRRMQPIVRQPKTHHHRRNLQMLLEIPHDRYRSA
jgi:hypothetical protein